MKKFVVLILLVPALLVCLQGAVRADERMNVVTTTSDLACIVSEVGKEKVNVDFLCGGNHDPHYFEIRPSMVVKVRKARLFVLLGMGLDAWAQSLIDAARNSDIKYGSTGYLDASCGIEKLEIPEGKIDGSMGDIHPYGNPHYWLDPANGIVVAEAVADRLAILQPMDKDFFQASLAEFKKKVSEKIEEWTKKLEACKGMKIVTYHRSWVYFCRRFDLHVACELEPKPGIPPSPSHLAEVVDLVKKEQVRALLIEPYYSRKAADFVAEKTGIKVLVCANSIGGDEGAKTYTAVIENVVAAICSAVSKTVDNENKK